MNKQTFVLTGIVAFKNSIHADARHYLAFCRNLEGRWYKYDDNEVTIKAIPVKRNIEIEGALLIYTQIS